MGQGWFVEFKDRALNLVTMGLEYPNSPQPSPSPNEMILDKEYGSTSENKPVSDNTTAAISTSTLALSSDQTTLTTTTTDYKITKNAQLDEKRSSGKLSRSVSKDTHGSQSTEDTSSSLLGGESANSTTKPPQDNILHLSL